MAVVVVVVVFIAIRAVSIIVIILYNAFALEQMTKHQVWNLYTELNPEIFDNYKIKPLKRNNYLSYN